MRLPLAAALLVPAVASAAPPARMPGMECALTRQAADAAAVCQELPGTGCWYVPPGAGAAPPLLIYLRGHFEGMRGAVPQGRRLESARQAFYCYGLGETARDSGYAILVTNSSWDAVDEDKVRRLEQVSGRTFPRRVVAAHSGGQVALGKTLDNGLQFDLLVMLDAFFASDGTLAEKIQARFQGRCRGFYSMERERNFTATFAPFATSCQVEPYTAGRDPHTDGVRDCLSTYLADRPCR